MDRSPALNQLLSLHLMILFLFLLCSCPSLARMHHLPWHCPPLCCPTIPHAAAPLPPHMPRVLLNLFHFFGTVLRIYGCGPKVLSYNPFECRSPSLLFLFMPCKPKHDMTKAWIRDTKQNYWTTCPRFSFRTQKWTEILLLLTISLLTPAIHSSVLLPSLFALTLSLGLTWVELSSFSFVFRHSAELRCIFFFAIVDHSGFKA